MDHRLDRVIQYFREEGMTVGAAGFTADAPAEGLGNPVSIRLWVGLIEGRRKIKHILQS